MVLSEVFVFFYYGEYISTIEKDFIKTNKKLVKIYSTMSHIVSQCKRKTLFW